MASTTEKKPAVKKSIPREPAAKKVTKPAVARPKLSPSLKQQKKWLLKKPAKHPLQKSAPPSAIE